MDVPGPLVTTVVPSCTMRLMLSSWPAVGLCRGMKVPRGALAPRRPPAVDGMMVADVAWPTTMLLTLLTPAPDPLQQKASAKPSTGGSTKPICSIALRFTLGYAK